MGFDGLRVIALESRRAVEMGELIRRQGGDGFVAPSMRELPLERNDETFAFAESLFAGGYDQMIFLTGVGTRALHRLLATRHGETAFPESLRRIRIAARGPKPLAALREMQVPVELTAPEPNTWRELMAALEGRTGARIAVQEYGRSNEELLGALRARGAEVTSVRIYEWDLPEDTRPLREAARRIAAGEAEVLLLTTSIQIPHLFQMAPEGELLAALKGMVIGSIGPTTSETLEEFGLRADMTPSHPKMGILVKEAGEQAAAILARKRGSTPRP
ncbi:MAG: uroporphyrinogen-III synthase [Acidobacteria bacterium]|nr:uroporphyrinogen-III synthase [Acidobacteriota bacterium]